MNNKRRSSSNSALPRKIVYKKDVSQTEKTPRDKLVEFFRSVGEWRDRILVIAGAFYLVGYIFWSINAYINNLGLLPALQFQYIVAGFVPVLVFVSAIVFWRFFWFLTNLWLSNLNKNTSKVWAIVRKAFELLAFLAVGGFIYSLSPSWALLYGLLIGFYILFKNEERINFVKELRTKFISTPYTKLSLKWQIFRVFLVIMLFAIVALFSINYKNTDQILFSGLLRVVPRDIVMNWNSYLLFFLVVFGGANVVPEFLSKIYGTFFMAIIIVGLALISLLVYYESAYLHLPQEFGGVKPRCAYLDIKTENLSVETRDSIITPSQTNATTILRSVELEVLFTSNNFVMARVNQPIANVENIVYEIPRSNIQAITWCE